MSPLLRVEDLRVYYLMRRGAVRAVDGVNLELGRGEAMGIVGESGSGKTTLALALARLIREPARVMGGRILFEGRDLLALEEEEMRRIRGRRLGYVFQDPFTSLDPLERVGEQLMEAIMVHESVEAREARERALRLLAEVGLTPDRLSYYPHQLSGGRGKGWR